MHTSVMTWVADQVARHGLATHKTLELGSRNINGSVRPLFSGEYVGIDMEEGPGVDRVALASALPFDDESFDLIVSTEMLEHDPLFWESLREMARILRPDGWLLLTARGIDFPLHDYPSDYWRFTEAAFVHLFEFAGLTPFEVSSDPEVSGVFGTARKGPCP